MRSIVAAFLHDERRKFFLRGVLLLLLMVDLVVCASGHALDDADGGGPFREIRMGLAAHDVDGLWSGSNKEDGPDVVAE